MSLNRAARHAGQVDHIAEEHYAAFVLHSGSGSEGDDLAARRQNVSTYLIDYADEGDDIYQRLLDDLSAETGETITPIKAFCHPAKD